MFYTILDAFTREYYCSQISLLKNHMTVIRDNSTNKLCRHRKKNDI